MYGEVDHRNNVGVGYLDQRRTHCDVLIRWCDEVQRGLKVTPHNTFTVPQFVALRIQRLSTTMNEQAIQTPTRANETLPNSYETNAQIPL